MHLLLKGESFWGLADRMKVSGSPTKVNVYNLGYVRACKLKDGQLLCLGLHFHSQVKANQHCGKSFSLMKSWRRFLRLG
jgi:hypothetical protein